ncbi:Coatomer subunit delta [Smittium culicis]|uniref:Coatomer subunit delta n=1 Tax=Smittium culicis TaxID=133412 RepID=A0A1R1Y0P7_9FUNG|nr:Coatomer subunit delta [Smittium culicis]
MTRGHIEGLLSSFPKLIIEGQQHTSVETDTVRYVFQPLSEDMYAVLITTKNSNIVQDMDTLQLISRSIPEVCKYISQEEIVENAFLLLNAFDEIISLGYRENIDLASLKTILEMDSQKEKIQDIIDRVSPPPPPLLFSLPSFRSLSLLPPFFNKEKEAKQDLKRKAKMFDMQRKMAGRNGNVSGSNPSFGNIGSYGNSFSSKDQSNYNQPESTPSSYSYKSKPAVSEPATRGMKLGRKPKAADILADFNNDVDKIQDKLQSTSIAPSSLPKVNQKSVHITVEENISAIVNRDGGLELMEVKGDLSLILSEEDKSTTSIRVLCVQDDSTQYKTHPNIDKKQFSESGLLTLKNQSRTFPLNQPVGVLKWRYVGQSEDSVPLNINCWPSPTGDGNCEVNIEYELNCNHMDLHDVVISIPLPSGSKPIIGDIDGSYETNRATGSLDWQIPFINSTSRSGSLDFQIKADNPNVFFPVSVSFVSTTTYCQIKVLEAICHDESVDYSISTTAAPDQYAVV